MTAFRQVVAKLQQGQREEAAIGLEFVLRLDQVFSPALNLQRQLTSGADEIDLSGIISDLQAPTTDDINETLVEAVEEFNQRRFVEAKERVEKVLLDLPGHEEARQLLGQIEEALKVETQVGQFLAQAQEALSGGDPQEAANFVMMAQALDPHHPGIDPTLREVNLQGGQVTPSSATEEISGGGDELPISFDTVDNAHAVFADFDFGQAADQAPSVGDGFANDTPVPQGSYAPPASAADNLSPASAFDAIPEAEVGIPSASDFTFGAGAASDAGDDLADLFEADPVGGVSTDQSSQVMAQRPAETGTDEDAERIHQLLEQGQVAFDRGDSQEAIDIWSRIYLIDPAHDLTTRRIDEARQRKEEVERRVEHMLYDAQEAESTGDPARAATLIDEVLALQPNHIAAVELKERFQASSPEPPAQESGALNAVLPELDDDLFSEEFVETSRTSHEDPLLDSDAVAPAEVPKSGRRGIPWRLGVFAVVALVVVVLGVWFGSRLLSSDSDEDDMAAVNRMLGQAEALYKQGQVDEAVHLLQEYPASGLAQTRIARRLAKYQQALAPPNSDTGSEGSAERRGVRR